ncbi:MAG TPA: hypothetical protein EYO33_01065, partial [Phycisphaerales bacterium]|nr:hypothetical protein [Phycisphaerales bacterium]
MTFDSNLSQLTISDNLLIEPTSTTSEFTFIPRAGVQEDPPGAIALLDPEVKMAKLFAGLGTPVLSNKGGGGLGSSEYRDATWTLPLPAGTDIEYEKKSTFLFKKYLRYGVYLKETSPGVGTLRISDGEDSFTQSSIGWLDFEPANVEKDPLGALEVLFIDLIRGKSVADDILTTTVLGSTLQEFDFSG